MIRSRQAFSLLEVIIATAILAASAMMLMSMFATGDRHTKRATERAIAQMLCESKLEELLVDPAKLVSIQGESFLQFPGWTSSVEVQPTTLPGLVQVSVSVTHLPGTDVGADLSITNVSTEAATTASPNVASLSMDPTFQITRWMKYEGELPGDDAPESPSTSLLDRLRDQQQ